jgi:hypothetical protein
MSKDMADRCPVGPHETVVQQDRHVPSLMSPNSCLVVRDRILARAALYYTERTNTEPLVVESRSASRWSRKATFAIARLGRESFALFHRQSNDNGLDI